VSQAGGKKLRSRNTHSLLVVTSAELDRPQVVVAHSKPAPVPKICEKPLGVHHEGVGLVQALLKKIGVAESDDGEHFVVPVVTINEAELRQRR
jgi:hypothetical protein